MSEPTPNVFLSYTIKKSAHDDTTLKVRQAFLDALAAQGMKPMDPMAGDQQLEDPQIHDDVLRSLRASDAVFVIEYPPVLNTAYETGLAFGLGIPSYHWLPDKARSRPVEEKETLQGYLRHLETDKLELASDLVGKRYETFPSDISFNGKSYSDFVQKISGFLSRLRSGPLSQHTIRARRAFRQFNESNVNLLVAHAESEPMSWVLESLAHQFSRYIEDGKRRFEIDESIYPTFLETLNRMPQSAKEVRAVADLSSDIERFWTRAPVRHTVGARIFRLPWTTFFDDRQLQNFLETVTGNADELYVTDADSRLEYLSRLRTGIDNNYVVFKDVVGYYEEEGESGYKKLIMERNPTLSASLLKEFDRTVDFSVRLTPSSNAQDVRKEWLRKRDIGKWSDTYKGGDHRGPEYYDNYDKHILTWIPGYTELIAQVGHEVTSHLAEVDRPLHSGFEGRGLAGEIGVGTGAVACHVARWADGMEKASGPRKGRALGRYYCIDSADPMLRSTELALKPFDSVARFRVAKGHNLDKFLSESNGQQLDVICGSLILHYLAEGVDAVSWRRLFDGLHNALRPDGKAVFAGCFFAADTAERQRQLEWWQGEMMRIGLSEEAADQFIKKNVPMTSMPPPEQLPTLSNGQFSCRSQQIGVRDSPFYVVTLQRGNAV